MFGKPSNPYDEIIAKATDEKQTEMNWEIALSVWDKVNEDGETGARNSVNSLTKRLTHRSANVQLFSLTLAGALVNNCGASLHREISGKSFTQALTRLINDRTTHESVKKEALKSIEEWVKEHQGNGDFDLMNDTYQSLKRQNHKFPSSIERQSTPPRVNDEALRREEEDLQRALRESAALTTSASTSSHYTPSQPPIPKALPSEPTPTSSSNPTRVEALFDFTGQTPEELEFKRGDVVKVIECLYQDWWKGELRGRTGIFPRNHVQPLPDLPPTPQTNPYSQTQTQTQQPMTEQDLEAEVFGQIANVDRLLQLMHSLRETGQDFADNDELTDLYNSSMMLRPRVVQLIRKYDQKKSELSGMNEKVMQARGIYEQMTGASQPQQQQQPPYSHPQPQPQTNGYSHSHQHPPAVSHEPPPQSQQAPPVHQQQDPAAVLEEQQRREYEAKWIEYERQMEEYNRQLAAHQQFYASQSPQIQGAPPPSTHPSDPQAQSYPSPSPHPHQSQSPELTRSHSQAYSQQPQSPPPPQTQPQPQPQPVWDGSAWVWPTQTAHVGEVTEGIQGMELRAQGQGVGYGPAGGGGGGQEDPAQWGQGQHQQQMSYQ
ncbi:hypothetical protein JCM5353_008884 [Sporobolomyces roseus]